ncbi:cytochrome P450 [Streptomyces fumanus]|uniref:Cytochrome P450 n=1 Tax=Streptomyces fumanus TaxID=67302 RepID=A0A919AD84_9ACTN|nr:cytochrome P450 [Streptomyces fumanus]GHF00115.1 cytochrome P450 [Streptomyces fumanus]
MAETRNGLPKGFRSAELGWPELHRIPHPPHRLPLLGDVRGADRANPIQDTLRYARDLGPIFRRRVFGKEFVFVWGAALAADLADESRFAKHVGLGVANLRPLAGDGLFTAYNHEPNWQLAHEVLAPGFSREAMAGYHPMMLDVAGRLMAHWDRAAAAGETVDVPGDMTKLTLETIARTGFGHDFGSFERARPHPFVTAMVGVLAHAQRLNTVPAPLSPWLLRRAHRRNAAHIAYLDRTVDDVVRARRSGRRSGPAGGDLLDLMLETAHPVTGERLSAENVRRQVITFLVAGHETTSGALSFALHYLSRHAGAAARARAEVDRVWGGTAVPGYEQVAKLRYVRRVLDESLRLWPTAPAFAREAREDTLLGGVHPMRRGAWAMVLTSMLHRDPEVWGPDAEEFDPDRFEAKAARSRAPHTFKPFGTGARACIGRQFALHEATLVLGLLLRRYDLRADPGYRLRVTERLTLMPEGLRLRPERRGAGGSGAAGAASPVAGASVAASAGASGPGPSAAGAAEARRAVVPARGAGAEGSAARCPVRGAGD